MGKKDKNTSTSTGKLKTLPSIVLKLKSNGNKIHRIKNLNVSSRVDTSHYDLMYDASVDKGERLKKLYIVPNIKNTRNCCLAVRNGKVSKVLPRTLMESEKENSDVSYVDELEVKGFALNIDTNEIVEIK